MLGCRRDWRHFSRHLSMQCRNCITWILTFQRSDNQAPAHFKRYFQSFRPQSCGNRLLLVPSDQHQGVPGSS
jgi:hypothetical protein